MSDAWVFFSLLLHHIDLCWCSRSCFPLIYLPRGEALVILYVCLNMNSSFSFSGRISVLLLLPSNISIYTTCSTSTAAEETTPSSICSLPWTRVDTAVVNTDQRNREIYIPWWREWRVFGVFHLVYKNSERLRGTPDEKNIDVYITGDLPMLRV